jgi:hypothetical protein
MLRNQAIEQFAPVLLSLTYRDVVFNCQTHLAHCEHCIKIIFVASRHVSALMFHRMANMRNHRKQLQNIFMHFPPDKGDAYSM